MGVVIGGVQSFQSARAHLYLPPKIMAQLASGTTAARCRNIRGNASPRGKRICQHASRACQRRSLSRHVSQFASEDLAARRRPGLLVPGGPGGRVGSATRGSHAAWEKSYQSTASSWQPIIILEVAKTEPTPRTPRKVSIDEAKGLPQKSVSQRCSVAIALFSRSLN